MIERQPYLPRFMAGGPGNPMGARALYIGGTVYRIHGTNQPQTIGTAVSSGCFRLVNADIEDLYRISPRLVFNAGQVRFAAEVEATAAAYGLPDAFGKVRDGHRVTNVRFLLGVYHFF